MWIAGFDEVGAACVEVSRVGTVECDEWRPERDLARRVVWVRLVGADGKS